VQSSSIVAVFISSKVPGVAMGCECSVSWSVLVVLFFLYVEYFVICSQTLSFALALLFVLILLFVNLCITIL
jgi:hypothetical protein